MGEARRRQSAAEAQDAKMVPIPDPIKAQLMAQLHSILGAEKGEQIASLLSDTRGLLKGAAVMMGLADEQGRFSVNVAKGLIGPPRSAE